MNDWAGIDQMTAPDDSLAVALDDLRVAEARLAAVEALADEWEADFHLEFPNVDHLKFTDSRADQLRAALTTQPPPQPATEPAAAGEGA